MPLNSELGGGGGGGGISQATADGRYTLKAGPLSDATGTRDIGSSSNLWKTLWLALTGLIQFGAGNSIGFSNGTGPVFQDSSSGVNWTLDTSGLTNPRTVIAPDAAGTMVLTTGAQTLASKTLTTPIIASLTNAQHNHTNAAGGGLLAASALGGFELSVAAQFDKAANTTLAAVTGLTASLAAATKYGFEIVLHIAADAVGGHKYSIDTSDTLTATAIIYQVNSINNGTNAFRINSRQTALGGSVGEAVGTGYFTTINGFIQTNAAGTFEVRFAQNSASGTSSVLVGSICRIWKTS